MPANWVGDLPLVLCGFQLHPAARVPPGSVAKPRTTGTCYHHEGAVLSHGDMEASPLTAGFQTARKALPAVPSGGGGVNYRNDLREDSPSVLPDPPGVSQPRITHLSSQQGVSFLGTETLHLCTRTLPHLRQVLGKWTNAYPVFQRSAIPPRGTVAGRAPALLKLPRPGLGFAGASRPRVLGGARAEAPPEHPGLSPQTASPSLCGHHPAPTDLPGEAERAQAELWVT